MYTAVLIEPRAHPALIIVLNNYNKNLDNNWEFLIYCGNNNKSYIEQIIKNESFKERKINIVELGVDNLTINEYNKVMFSEFYYDNINTEMFLVFQIDTLLSDVYSKNIYDFIKYDYVGAPWFNYYAVGNGGLSFRRKSKMLELLRSGGIFQENGDYHYEDRFFSNTINNGNESKIIVNKPSVEEAKRFSVETMFYDKSVGFHKPWFFVNIGIINQEDYNKLKEHFYDLEELYKLSMV